MDEKNPDKEEFIRDRIAKKWEVIERLIKESQQENKEKKAEGLAGVPGNIFLPSEKDVEFGFLLYEAGLEKRKLSGISGISNKFKLIKEGNEEEVILNEKTGKPLKFGVGNPLKEFLKEKINTKLKRDLETIWEAKKEWAKIENKVKDNREGGPWADFFIERGMTPKEFYSTPENELSYLLKTISKKEEGQKKEAPARVPEIKVEKKETFNQGLQSREAKIANTINSIIKHGLVSPEKAKELDVKILKGADNTTVNKSKGVLATIEEIPNIKEFREKKGKNASKKEYLDYFQWKVWSLVNGAQQRSPVAILGERETPEIAEEIKKNGKEIVEERLRSGVLILMSTNESYKELEEKNPYHDAPGTSTGGILAFSELKPDSIEAIFVPSEIFNNIRNNVPKNLRSKLIEVKEEIIPEPKDAVLYGQEIIDNKLRIPDWPAAVSKYLSGAKLNKTFMMHGVRLPTQKEFNVAPFVPPAAPAPGEADSNKIETSPPIPRETERITSLINALPEGVRARIKEVTFEGNQGSLASGEIAANIHTPLGKSEVPNNKLQFRDVNFANGDFYHEIGHIILAHAVETGDESLLKDFIKADRETDSFFTYKLSSASGLMPPTTLQEYQVLENQFLEETNLEKIYSSFSAKYKWLEENFAEKFSRWMQGESAEPSLEQFFKDKFPTAKPLKASDTKASPVQQPAPASEVKPPLVAPAEQPTRPLGFGRESFGTKEISSVPEFDPYREEAPPEIRADYLPPAPEQRTEAPSWQESEYNDSLPVAGEQPGQDETLKENTEGEADYNPEGGGAPPNEENPEKDEDNFDDAIPGMDRFPSEDEIEEQINAASAGERVSFTDPDFLLILIFAVIVDLADIILEILGITVIPKLIGMAIDAVVFAIIGGWMNKRGIRLSDSKKAAQAVITDNMKKQMKNLERLKKIGQVNQKAFDRYTRRYAKQMGKTGTALAKAARSPTGRTLIKSGLAFLGELIWLIGILPFWTISVISTLREK